MGARLGYLLFITILLTILIPIQAYCAPGDPIWHTFQGGSGSDYSMGIDVDTSNNVYIVGHSNSTWGSPINPYNSSDDVYVVKLASNGSLTWSTFLGSSGFDYGAAICVDNSSNVYVCGESDATWGSPINPYTGDTDIFVAKLASNGSLIWLTFLGSADTDSPTSIALDDSGNLYISGSSWATWGSPQRAYTSNRDGIVVKLNNNGTLLWNTFLGNSPHDSTADVTTDTSGNVYVNGYSHASWGSPINAHTIGTETEEAFVAKLASNGTLTWNTFFGGANSEDYGAGIVLYNNDTIYTTGESNTTWGSPVRSYTADIETHVVKLANNGTLLWNTFLGTNGYDAAQGISVDSNENINIVGYSAATWGSPVTPFGSGFDAYVAQLNSSGSLLWNTFMEGSFSQSISTAANGNIFTCGYSDGTWGSPVRSFTSGNDGFAVKLAGAAVATTPTYTITPSVTPANTSTPSITPSNTSTPSVTPANTSTPSVTPANTSTPSVTMSNTSTPNFTATFTPTISVSPTHSPSPTITRTTTPSPSVTLTNTTTPIVSMTPSLTGSPSMTQTPVLVDNLITNLVVYPNPFRAKHQKITIQYVLNQDAQVMITFYAYLGNKIKSIRIKAGEPGGQGHALGLINEVIWDGRNNQGLLQATGGYICQIVAKSQDGKRQESHTVKIALIR